MKDKVSTSIIVGPHQEVLGVRVGMHFTEIRTILGARDFGPDLGMDNRHYMDYFFGEIKDGVPETLVSFSAASNDCPTDLAFIKWEAFEYSQMGVQPYNFRMLDRPCAAFPAMTDGDDREDISPDGAPHFCATRDDSPPVELSNGS